MNLEVLEKNTLTPAQSYLYVCMGEGSYYMCTCRSVDKNIYGGKNVLFNLNSSKNGSCLEDPMWNIKGALGPNGANSYINTAKRIPKKKKKKILDQILVPPPKWGETCLVLSGLDGGTSTSRYETLMDKDTSLSNRPAQNKFKCT